MLEEPFQPCLEIRQSIQELWLNCLHRQEGDKPNQRTDSQRDMRVIWHMQYVVEELILFVPQRDTLSPNVVERISNVEEVLEKLGGDVLICLVFACQFQGNHEHIQTIHPHPGSAI